MKNIMVNNFELIKPLMVFPKPEDSFYFLQILQRKKDFPGVRIGGSNNNSRLIKAYYIDNVEYLDIHAEEIIKLCEVFSARASINLNPRSYEKAAFQVMQKISNQMMNREFHVVRKAYDSICGMYHKEMDKRWLVDIDKQDIPIMNDIKLYIEVVFKEAHGPDKGTGVLAEIPSKNGYHLITRPFNMESWGNSKFKSIEVHKNNPTNLYIP